MNTAHSVTSPPGVHPASSDFRRSLWTCCTLTIVGLALYAQVLAFRFVNFDDDVHVSENAHVTSGLSWENTRWAFEIHGPSQWHPLAWLSHQIDCELFGLQAGGHHATSVLLHLATGNLLFLCLQSLLRRWGVAAFIALAFVVHPLNVESVAWVSERRNVLCGLFFVLTMWSYQWYVSRPTYGRYLLLCAGHLAALMSKPMAVTLPCVLLLLDFWPLRRWSIMTGTDQSGVEELSRSPKPRFSAKGPFAARGLVAEKVPLLVMSAGASYLTILCQRAVGTIASFDAIPLPLRLLNAVAAYGWYLQHLLWPLRLAVFYPHPALVDRDPWNQIWPAALLSAVTLGLLLLLAWRLRARYPSVLIGLLWYLGVMFPMIGVLQVGEQQQADRYFYLPGIGLGLAFAGLLDAIWRERQWSPFWLKGIGALLLGFWTVLAYAQVGVWRDSVQLFSHAVSVTRRNHWGHNNLGMAYLKQNRLALAAEQFQRAIVAVPSYGLAHYNMGVAWDELGRTADAEAELSIAVELDPANSLARQRLGALYLRQGNVQAGLTQFEAAARRSPGDPIANFNFGLALARTGNPTEALAWLETAIRLDPSYGEAVQALAGVLVELNRRETAIQRLESYLSQSPDDVDAQQLLENLRRQP